MDDSSVGKTSGFSVSNDGEAPPSLNSEVLAGSRISAETGLEDDSGLEDTEKDVPQTGLDKVDQVNGLDETGQSGSEKINDQKNDTDSSSIVTQTGQSQVSEVKIPRGRGRPPRNANRTDIGPSGLVSITSIWADDDKPKGKRGRPRLRPLGPEEKTEPEVAPNKPLKVKRPKGPSDILHDIIHRLYKRDKQQIFAEPVNSEFVPDYYHVIKNPMDFSTMRKKVSQGEYKDFDSFAADIRLIISNCYTYNKIGTMVYRMGLILEETWDKSLEGSKTRYEQAIRNVQEYEEKKNAGEIISDSDSEHQQMPAWNQTPCSPHATESPNPSNQRSMVTRRMEARLSNAQSPWKGKSGERDYPGFGQEALGRRSLAGNPLQGGAIYQRGDMARNQFNGQSLQNQQSRGPTLVDVCRGGVVSIRETLEKLKADRLEPFSSLARQLATQPCIRSPTVDDWYVFDKQLSDIQYRNSVKRFIGDDSIQALKKIMDIETALLEIDPYPSIAKAPLSDTRILGVDTEDFAPFNQNLSVDGSFLLGVGENHVKLVLSLQEEFPELDLSALKELVTKYTQHPPNPQPSGAPKPLKPIQGSFPVSPGVGTGGGVHQGLGKPIGPNSTQLLQPVQTHSQLHSKEVKVVQGEEPKAPDIPQRPIVSSDSKGLDRKPVIYNRYNGRPSEGLPDPAEIQGMNPSLPPSSHLPPGGSRMLPKHGFPLGSGGNYLDPSPPAKVQKFDSSHIMGMHSAKQGTPPGTHVQMSQQVNQGNPLGYNNGTVRGTQSKQLVHGPGRIHTHGNPIQSGHMVNPNSTGQSNSISPANNNLPYMNNDIRRLPPEKVSLSQNNVSNGIQRQSQIHMNGMATPGTQYFPMSNPNSSSVSSTLTGIPRSTDPITNFGKQKILGNFTSGSDYMVPGMDPNAGRYGIYQNPKSSELPGKVGAEHQNLDKNPSHFDGTGASNIHLRQRQQILTQQRPSQAPHFQFAPQSQIPANTHRSGFYSNYSGNSSGNVGRITQNQGQIQNQGQALSQGLIHSQNQAPIQSQNQTPIHGQNQTPIHGQNQTPIHGQNQTLIQSQNQVQSLPQNFFQSTVPQLNQVINTTANTGANNAISNQNFATTSTSNINSAGNAHG
ncbi:bromodomain-containing protein [Cryptosporidium felis]|nr:bromodomain-containing protein [Cryptosporidium felis]